MTNAQMQWRSISGIETREDLPENEFIATISNEERDRHGTIIKQDGLDLEKYSGQVLYQHNVDRLIGKCLDIWTEDSRTVAHFRIHPRHADIIQDLNEEYLTDVSIGFRTLEREGDVITKADLMEFSVVTIGSNASAGITAREFSEVTKKYGLNVNQLKKAMRDLNQFIEAIEMDRKPDDEKESYEDKTLRELCHEMDDRISALEAEVFMDEEPDSEEEPVEEPEEEDRSETAQLNAWLSEISQA